MMNDQIRRRHSRFTVVASSMRVCDCDCRAWRSGMQKTRHWLRREVECSAAINSRRRAGE